MANGLCRLSNSLVVGDNPAVLGGPLSSRPYNRKGGRARDEGEGKVMTEAETGGMLFRMEEEALGPGTQAAKETALPLPKAPCKPVWWPFQHSSLCLTLKVPRILQPISRVYSGGEEENGPCEPYNSPP